MRTDESFWILRPCVVLAALSLGGPRALAGTLAPATQAESASDLARSCRRILHLRSGAVWAGVARLKGETWQVKRGAQWIDVPARHVLRAPKETDVKALPDGISADDWARIQETYEAGRYAAQATAEGYEARNPGQRWLTHFDGRGFLTEPDAGAWTWGLELTSYGFGGCEQVVTSPARVIADGGRVSYAWSRALTEWYLNDRRGLEHGYTVHERPAQDGHAKPGPLTFTLAVRGGLRPEVMAGGRDVRFLDEAGKIVLTYSGLSVFDADGQGLVASFESEGERLHLSIDERDARYPLTIDPIVHQAYLKASNTESQDQFGGSIAVSGNTIVVGAPMEDSNATGVNGNQGDNNALVSGAAYVFVRNGTTWTQQAYLKASNTGAGDRFGHSVAASGDTIVVGALQESSNATGVNGNQGDNSAMEAGAAYVFVRSGTTWSQQAYLKASNTEGGDHFSDSVGVSGDTIVVGASRERSNATGVNGNQGDNTAQGAGAAYVFVRGGTTWTQQAYLKASNTDGLDIFGFSVAVSGDTIVVGAFNESSNGTGVNGNQADNSASGAGAAYVFVRGGTTWSQQAYLKASNTDGGDVFGFSVAMSGDTIVVGAVGESSMVTGVNGNQGNNSAQQAGAAYVFVRSGTAWRQQAYLKASNTDLGDIFGASVAASADTIGVAAPGEASGATGVNGSQGNDSFNAGAVYVFVRSGTTWSQQAYLKASNTGANDEFGNSIAASGDTVVAGARAEASNGFGLGGNPGDNSAPLAGASYAFVSISPGAPFCFGDSTGVSCPCSAFGAAGQGCANTTGLGAVLSGSGLPRIAGDSFQLAVSGVPGAKAGLILRGDSQVAIPAGDGILCTSGASQRSHVQVTVAGATVFTNFNGAPFGSVANVGAATHFQFWYLDPANTCSGAGFNFTNGWTVTYLP